MFKPGDKVLCIETVRTAYAGPIAGRPYKVRSTDVTGTWLALVGMAKGENWPAVSFALIGVDEMPVIAGPGRKVGDSLFSEDATFTPDETTGGVKGAKACRYDLVPVRPLAEVAAVLGQGAAKYSENNWRKGYDWGKSYAAAQRHMNRFWAGEKVDPDSGLHPLAHAIANLMFLIEFTESHPELDDRGDAPV